MSCSQFIEHDDEDKSDTLVVIVNGDGTVSVDRETLERVLQQQCRAAVSFIKLEDTNEPDSQSGKAASEERDAPSEDKEALSNKVNLVIEGYYPPPPLSMASKNNGSADSVVSSTVATPPLPQSSSDFLDLLSEGLEIPVSNVPTSSNEDTLQLKEEDDWVHFDHCYTNIYGNRKSSPTPCKVENVQDSEEATYVTIKVGENGTIPEANSTSAQSNTVSESLPEKKRELVKTNEVSDSQDESAKLKRRTLLSSNAIKNENSNEKSVLPKRNATENVKNLMNTAREKRAFHMLSKVKRKSIPKSEPVEPPVERIVTEDEVDGVKVFKPTRNDKKLVRPFVFSKDPGKNMLLSRSQLIQTKLNFNKKEENESIASTGPVRSLGVSKEKPESNITRPDTSSLKHRSNSICETDESNKNVKKETPRKQPPPVPAETFGPALFSTPDIIRKINNDETLKESDKFSASNESLIVDETADIEKRMSAIENGEAILDRIHMQFEMQNKQRYLSDDERLLSDLENTDDESNQMESEISTSLDTTKKTESAESNSELSSRKSSNVDKSENSDKDEVDYEDDPNKLWCICNKPHGNRFMICCDACDNWYHGSCVGVTRPMGEKMELNGTEWLCPSCRKDKCAKEREMKLKLATRSTANRTSGKQSISNSLNPCTSDAPPTAHVSSGERASSQVSAVRRKSSSQPMKIPPSQLCIECKEKEIMPNAIYCSKTCIIKQVDTFVSTNSSPSDPLPDEQKIIVVDKKRDHRITGMRAPSVANLKEWLIEHPSYEIVRPSAFPMSRPLPSVRQQNKPIQKPVEPMKSSNSISNDVQNVAATKKLSLKLKDSGQSLEGNPQTSIKQFFGSKSTNDVNPSKVKKMDDGSGNILIREGNVLRTVSTVASKKEAELRMKEKQRQIKLIPVQPLLKQGEEQKPVQQIVRKVIIPTPSVDKEKKRKTEISSKEKPPAPKKTEMKKQESKKSVEEVNDANEQTPLVAKGPEPVRPKLKKSLSDLFISRSKDINDLTVPETDLISLAAQVEEELFNYFKDTGQKYKNKYRSLVFNLRDQKNNLFRRVADKSLTPHELVRLTPEELASTELAQWRQREAKHEIDMIKKTELENLSQTKVLVVKTHKGELEIEPHSLPPSKADIVVPDLQPDEFPIEKEKGKTYTSSALSKDGGRQTTSTKDKSSSKDDNDKKDRHKKSDHRDKDRHKSRKHRHRSSEHDHHRSRSRRRSKSGEKDSHKNSTVEKTSSSSHHNRSSDKSRNISHSIDKDRHQSRSKRKRSRSRSRRKLERKDDTAIVPVSAIAAAAQSNDVENRNEATEKLPTTVVEMEKPTEDEEKIAADLLSSYNAVDVDLSDMEPTSTVIIKTPPYAHSPESPAYVWKGVLNVPEAAKVLTVLKEVSGNCEDLDEDLPAVLEGVGRLKPEVMWRYISEVKKSGHEILVLRFEVQDESQQHNYLSVYSHLSTKERMGVIGCSCPSIKDFYVMTLASHSPIPQILLPLNGPGFEDNRSQMLLAIIVRTRRKRYSSGISLSHSSRPSRRVNVENGIPTLPPVVTPVVENDSFTPPHSPTSVFVNNSVTVPSATDNDGDEPYSPGDDDEEEEEEPYSPSALDDDHSNKSSDVERELEEINRKIAEEKQKIKEFESGGSALTTESVKESIELYSPTKHLPGEMETPSVQLPEDLQQLLNSFSKRNIDSTSGILQTDPIVSAYKSHKRDNVDDVEDAPVDTSFSSPEVGSDRIRSIGSEALSTSETAIEESKLNRDPRRKQLTESYTAPVNQPPPPGMEDEFSVSGISAAQSTATTSAESTMLAVNVPDPAYTVPLQAASFSYTVAAAAAAVAPVPQYPPSMMAAHQQMFMATAPVFPQPGTLPYTSMPAAQIYVPPTVLHHDPSMIPLPIDGGDQSNLLKRKAVDDVDDDDKEKGGSRKFDSKAKKNPAYYSTDVKSRSDSRSPSRHKGSGGYDSRRRDFSRDDADYGSSGSSSSHSRYSNKHGKSYSNRRSGYWKGGNDYSSNHRKYSDRSRRSSRSSSREKSSRRYDTAKSS